MGLDLCGIGKLFGGCGERSEVVLKVVGGVEEGAQHEICGRGEFWEVVLKVGWTDVLEGDGTGGLIGDDELMKILKSELN